MTRIAPALLFGMLLPGVWTALANEAPPPRPREVPTKVTVPVVVKHADLKGEGEGVQAKLVLPSSMKGAPGLAPNGRKVGANEQVAPTQRSIVAAIALSLAAVSIVFVLRGKKLTTATKAAILGVAGLLGLLGVGQADLSVPGQPRRPPPMPRVLEKPEGAAKSSLVIEYSDDVKEAVLTLPAK